MLTVWLGLAAALALPASSGGCLWPTDAPYLADEPGLPLVVVASDPAPGAEQVALVPQVHFWFDGRVHPDSVHAGSLRLAVGPYGIPASRRVDLLACRVSIWPHVPLAPLLAHRATVEGVSGFGRGPLSPGETLIFVTGEASEVPAPPADVPDLERLVSGLFATRCRDCHGAFRPAAGLDLSTTEAAWGELVGRASQARPGETRVLPGRHASSYLMWKLLGLPGIVGDPMPPGGDWPTDRSCSTPDPDLRRVAAWIDGLATTDASR